MSKKLISFLFSAMLIFSHFDFSFAHNNINLTPEQKKSLVEESSRKAQNDETEIPLIAQSSGIIPNYRLNQPLVISKSLNGDLSIENSSFKKNIYIFAKDMKKLSFKNTTIQGDIYVIEISNDAIIEFETTVAKNIFINTPVQIYTKDKSSRIKDIIISKELKANSDIKINSNVKNLINNAENINLTVNGKIDVLSTNAKFNLKGKNSHKVSKSFDYNYHNVITYDLNDFGENKGFSDIKDNSSYEDFYNLFKRHQNTRDEKLSIILKNTNKENMLRFETAISEKFYRFLPNHSYGMHSTLFQEDEYSYALYNLYFLYDTDNEKMKQAQKSINSIYDKIKHLKDIDYVKEVNRILAQKIVYDSSLSKHSMYDALISSSSVCEGYAKAGYELLQKKFGKENTLIIVNEDHMWNMLKLNGRWYHIDFTHNDPTTSNPMYFNEEFLLLSDSELKSKSPERTWNYNIYPKAE